MQIAAKTVLWAHIVTYTVSNQYEFEESFIVQNIMSTYGTVNVYLLQNLYLREHNLLKA